MKHGSVFINGGFRPAIVKEGPKWSQVVFINGTHVIMRKVRGKLNAKPINGYSSRKLASALLRRKNVLGLKMHISKTARRILEEARS